MISAFPLSKRLCRNRLLASVVTFSIAMCCGVAASTAAQAPNPIGRTGQTTPRETAVKVKATHEGGVTRFFVENDEYCEVTMTFLMGLVNMRANEQFPYTATFPPHQTSEAFEVFPIKPGEKWEYSYTNFYKLGSNSARHDDSFVYQLPYGPGNKFKVTQAYNGKFSHTGSNQYAIDWDMPEGTMVHAARGGLVVRMRDDSDKGGAGIDYDRYNNYVLIRHNDGTLGHYCHLQKGGCLVKVGQTVATGDPIARSGNTGFSSGPHLHFCVFRTKDGRERVSIPVKFRTNQEQSVTLTSGHSYRAAEIQSATAPSGTKQT
jgi:murein DD-endopeptidase MepM/ murein hydrolase activator NlpD